jgi:ABC-type nickel/cobalt efflux system permease component RcnA
MALIEPVSRRKGREGKAMDIRRIAVIGFVAWTIFASDPATAHPLGNFSISHYSAIHIRKDTVELRYIIDMAEIPTFQEIQEQGITADVDDANVQAYVARKAEILRDGLSLRVGGKLLRLQVDSKQVIFPPGAGGLPTMKIGMLVKAKLDGASMNQEQAVDYRDDNFPGRAGWKEIIATADPNVKLMNSSVPGTDRSRQLSDYPIDLLNSPPQQLTAQIGFISQSAWPSVASVKNTVAIAKPLPLPPAEPTRVPRMDSSSGGSSGSPAVQLTASKQATPRNSFTEMMATKQLSLNIILLALVVAVGLGAFHALEPGHGKTLVAAYLIGSRGTFKHAVLLGLIVTASHTAGVYLLGAVTLYASQYIVPEQLYPWLGLVSGVMIFALGVILLVQRHLRRDAPSGHVHHGHSHHALSHPHHHDHHHGHEHHHAHHERQISLRELMTLGISGGIVPCPAALVVLLSAVSMQRIGFGLLLIVAFSMGLAAVLIAVGMLMVYARQFMARFRGEGRIVTRWLPLTSSAFIVLFGIGLTWQALVSVGFIRS